MSLTTNSSISKSSTTPGPSPSPGPNARKCKLIDEFDKVVEPITNASAHACIGSVSPFKRGKTKGYFVGVVADAGGNSMKYVGFSRSQQRKMEEMLAKKELAFLDDFEVKTWN